MFALVALLSMVLPTKAMSYEQARREAFFLTDKMAYELNLTQEQYDAAYEINLDYLMGVTSVDDVFSDYWRRRNLDMSYILLKWQWEAFCAASYFYRPLYWADGFWHFAIYARYPRRNYFFFSRPTVYISYRGGHSWRHNGGRSYYYAHRDRFHKPAHHGGMRDRWQKGELRNPHVSHPSRPPQTKPGGNNALPGKPAGNSFGGSRRGGSFRNGSQATPPSKPNGTATNRPTSSGTFRAGQSQRQTTSDGSPTSATRPTGTSSPSQRGNSFGGSRSGGSFRNASRPKAPTAPARSNTSGSTRRVSPSGASRGGSFRPARSGSSQRQSNAAGNSGRRFGSRQ